MGLPGRVKAELRNLFLHFKLKCSNIGWKIVKFCQIIQKLLKFNENKIFKFQYLSRKLPGRLTIAHQVEKPPSEENIDPCKSGIED